MPYLYGERCLSVFYALNRFQISARFIVTGWSRCASALVVALVTSSEIIEIPLTIINISAKSR
ncbi:hypothetical protein VPHK453_0033 [Vibrio phage K453]